MNIQNLVRSTLKGKSPVILTALAGVGTLTTAYLASKASFKAAKIIALDDQENGPVADRKEAFKKNTKLVWKLYIPPAVSATSTIVCVVGSNRIATQKTLAAQAALALSQRAYSDYREQVVDEFSKGKDKKILDKVAEKKVSDNPPPSQSKDVVMVGAGDMLCCELHTMRYFTSSVETLRRAENELNKKLLRQDTATLDDWYYILDLKQTTTSGKFGWESGQLMELNLSYVGADDGRPCLAFEYNYLKPV